MEEKIGLCSKCHKNKRAKTSHSYCKSCRNAYSRENRKKHPLTKKQKMKDIARSYAGQYLRRGKIKKKPCKKCGSSKSQMHHPDYCKPIKVVWLCRKHHLELHKKQDKRIDKSV